MRVLAGILVGCVHLVGCGAAGGAHSPQVLQPSAQAPSNDVSRHEHESSSAAGEVESEDAVDAVDGRRRLGVSDAVMRGSGLEPSSPAPSEAGLGGMVQQILVEFAQAEAMVLAQGASCQRVCQALDSMVRSANRLCAMASRDDEKLACEEAQRRVRLAVEMVRASCGACERGSTP